MAKENEVVDVLKEIKNVLQNIAERIGLKAPNARFIDNGDGTISDTIPLKNGKRLMWQKEGSDKEMNQESAKTYCKDLKLAGHDDWYLPLVDESFSLVDHTKNNPAIDPVFKCKSDCYWTDTPYAGASGYAWVVGFSSGSVYSDSLDYGGYVRAVRQY